jgi:hypothetical protein
MCYRFLLVIDTFQNVHEYDMEILKHLDPRMYPEHPNTSVCLNFTGDADNDVFVNAWIAQQYSFAETHSEMTALFL